MAIWGVVVGVWTEKVSKILGEEIREERGSSRNRCGGFSDLSGRLAFAPMGLHNKRVAQA